MRPPFSTIRFLVLATVVVSLAELVCISYVSQTWAARSQRLYQLMDGELFEVENLVCGLLPDGWVSGTLVKSGKFKPKSRRITALKRALRSATGEEASALRRKLRRTRKKIRKENELCEAAAPTVVEQPTPTPVPTPPTGTTQGTDTTPGGPSGDSPGGLTPAQPTPIPTPILPPTVDPSPSPEPSPGTPIPVPTTSPLDVLDGAQIFAAKVNGFVFEPDDSKPLGVISRDASDPNSLANPTGPHGSGDPGSVSSIFNPQSPYGNPQNPFTAFSDPTVSSILGGVGSPFIRKNGVVMGRLTTANLPAPNIPYNTCQVLEWLGRRQDRPDVCP